jgi:hypothetical protein
LAAERNPPKVAKDADEGTALGAGIPLRRALFPAAGAAFHSIVLAELSHRAVRK